MSEPRDSRLTQQYIREAAATEEQRDRSIEAKIERLRQRLAKAVQHGAIDPRLAAVLSGFLDLLGDEL